MQMRREQLKKLEVAAVNSGSVPSFVDGVEFAVMDIVMRSYIWFVAKVFEVATAVANVFSRQENNDLSLVDFKMMALAVFSSTLRNETKQSKRVGDAYDILAECVAQAKRGQECVLARIHDAGGVDAIENSDLRAEFDHVSVQAEAIIQNVDVMYHEVVTLRNIWK